MRSTHLLENNSEQPRIGRAASARRWSEEGAAEAIAHREDPPSSRRALRFGRAAGLLGLALIVSTRRNRLSEGALALLVLQGTIGGRTSFLFAKQISRELMQQADLPAPPFLDQPTSLTVTDLVEPPAPATKSTSPPGSQP